MYGHVAANALATGLESEPAVGSSQLPAKSGVALQAELPAFAPDQQQAVGSPVWIVAADAALRLHCRVLEHKRSAFLDVALHAGFLSWIIEAGHVLRTVRAVAVRTLHQPFGNTVVFGLRKLGLNRLMATEAERRLGLFQQAGAQPAVFFADLGELEEIGLRIRQARLARVLYFIHQMGRVALTAGYTVGGMLGMFEPLLLLARDMARQAAGSVFLCRTFKRKNRVRNHRLGNFSIVAVRRLDGVAMRFSRTVTRFTTVNIVLAWKNDLGVTGLLVFDRFALMAVLAGLGSGKLAGKGVKLRRAAGDGRAPQRFRALLREDSGGETACN